MGSVEFTATGRFFYVYVNGIEISKHYTEREAIEAATNAALALTTEPLPRPSKQAVDRIHYTHEYEVDVRVIGSVADQGGGSDTEPPSVPTGLVATPINKNQVDLLWQASTDNIGVTGYQIFRDSSPLDTTAHPVVSYSDTSVVPSTLYSYTVAAFDAEGNTSNESGADTATTPANAPPVWSAIPDQVLITGNAFNLDFDDFADDVDVETLTYTIISGTLPTGVTQTDSIISGTPTTSGESSTITVRADDGNDTADTNFDIETFDADVTAPPVPTGLASGTITSSTIDLSWNASIDVQGGANEFVSGTASYRLYRDSGLVIDQAGLTYNDSGLQSDTQYSYTVSVLDVAGNESAQSGAVLASTTAAAALEDDWLARISGPGVVWYHDFRNAAEVDAFRWTGGYSGGNDPLGLGRPGTVIHQTSDGVTGNGCLEIFRASGTSNPSDWWRPFSPLDTGSGKSVSDPGANGLLPAQTWAPSDGSSTTFGWDNNAARPGFYGPADYHDTHSANSHDGTEYYLQMRVKRDPRRTATNNTDTPNKRVGKHNYQTINRYSLSQQEIVTYSGGVPGTTNQGDPQYHRMYGRAFSPIEQWDSLGRPGQQVGHDGADYGAGQFCDIDSSPSGQAGNCWTYSGGWDTLLYHIVPGHTGVEDQHIAVYAANEGETEYTKIWDFVMQMNFDGDQGYTGNGIFPTGYNAIIASAYQNTEDMGTDFWERFDQFIFSKNYIPCPQSGALPSWYPAVGEVAEISSGTTIRSAGTADGLPGGMSIADPWSGGAITYVSGQPYLLVNGGGHGDGQYNGILKFGPLYGGGSNSPTWSVFLSASDSGDWQEGPEYADGRQAAVHTYNEPVGVGETYYMMATSGYASIGNSSNNAYSFTPDGQVQITNNIRTGGAGTGNHYLGKIYYASGETIFDRLRIYDITTDTWTSESNANIAFQNYITSAIDHTRGGMYAYGGTGGGSTQSGAYWNLSTLARNTGQTRPTNFGEWAMVYDEDRDAFVTCDGSKTVYECDAASLYAGGDPGWTSRTFTGDTPATPTSNGIFGRFQYVHELKGYILCPNEDSSVYFYRSA